MSSFHHHDCNYLSFKYSFVVGLIFNVYRYADHQSVSVKEAFYMRACEKEEINFVGEPKTFFLCDF